MKLIRRIKVKSQETISPISPIKPTIFWALTMSNNSCKVSEWVSSFLTAHQHNNSCKEETVKCYTGYTRGAHEVLLTHSHSENILVDLEGRRTTDIWKEQICVWASDGFCWWIAHQQIAHYHFVVKLPHVLDTVILGRIWAPLDERGVGSIMTMHWHITLFPNLSANSVVVACCVVGIWET